MLRAGQLSAELQVSAIHRWGLRLRRWVGGRGTMGRDLFTEITVRANIARQHFENVFTLLEVDNVL
jgi:hypothetical protein